MTLPTGLASISSQWDDTPHARGAIDMAQRLRRAEALTQLAELDAEHLTEQAAIDRHAALAICEAYRAQDTRAIVFRAGGRVEVVR